jgi:hypothetical protein
MAAEWDDAYAVALGTSRIALSGPVAELQRIRRGWREVEPPEGLGEFHENMVAFQDATIEGFLAFMAEKPDWEVGAHFDSAHRYYMQAFDSTSDEYLARAEVATPTPTSTPTQTSTPTPTGTPTPTPAVPTEWKDYEWTRASDHAGRKNFTVSYPADWPIGDEEYGVRWDVWEYGHVSLDCYDGTPWEWHYLWVYDDKWDDDDFRLESICNEKGWLPGTTIDQRVEQIGDYKCYIVSKSLGSLELIVIGVLGDLQYTQLGLKGTTFELSAWDIGHPGDSFHENELKTFWKIIESLKIK